MLTPKHIMIHTTGGNIRTNTAYHVMMNADGTIHYGEGGNFTRVLPHGGTNVSNPNAHNGIANAVNDVRDILPSNSVNMNNVSIGYAFNGMTFIRRTGIDSLSDIQKQQGIDHIIKLMKQFDIPVTHVIGHGEVVPAHRVFCPMPMHTADGRRLWDNAQVLALPKEQRRQMYSPFMRALRAEIKARLEKEVLELIMRYNTLEEMPSWAVPTIQKLMDNGSLVGGDKGLDLSHDMIRLLVIHDRMGLYG